MNLLKTFKQEVYDLDRKDPNYLERGIVVGEQVTLDRSDTTRQSILYRLQSQIERLIQRTQSNPINDSRTLQATHPINKDGDSIEDAEIVNTNSES